MKNRTWKQILSVILTVSVLMTCVSPSLIVKAEGQSSSASVISLDQASQLMKQGVIYRDGTYEGTGRGRNGDIKLSITITNGEITDIETVSHQETPSYWNKAKQLFEQLLGSTSSEEVDAVDCISGATLSCNGIKEAVKDALSKAEAESGNGIFAGGTGTSEDPYVIDTEQQMRNFAASVNEGTDYLGQYIRLDTDLDLSDAQWTPAGQYQGETAFSFRGSFDGSGHVISGMTIGTAAEPADLEAAGLFGVLGEGGRIHNLGVTDAHIYNHLLDRETRPMAGILAASMDGSSSEGISVIDHCYTTGTISNYSETTQYAYLGGLAGASGWGTLISNSWTDVTIETDGHSSNFVGGITGQGGNESAVVNCASFGNVTGEGGSSNAVGGIVGEMAGIVYNCYATGNTTTDDISYGDMPDVAIGAIVGETPYLFTAYNCYFNEESVQTVNGDVQSTVYAIGLDPYSWCAGDDTYCYGKPAGDFAAEEFASLLNEGLSEEQTAAADSYFITENSIVQKELMEYAAFTESGWASWVLQDGRVLPETGIDPNPGTDIFAGGIGTAENPFVIHTEDQLRNFAVSVNEGTSYFGQYVTLDTDITLVNGDWIPVGITSEAVFDGTFLGAGHTVSGMIIGSDAQPASLTYAGFFGVTGNHIVLSDFHLADAEVYAATAGSTRGYAGAMMGQAGTSYDSQAVIDGCSVAGGTVSGCAEGAYSYAGGLAASLMGGTALVNSWTDIAVSALSDNGMAMAGGLAALGSNQNLVMNCAALGDVTASGYNFTSSLSNFAGGLLGMPGGVICNCYASGDIAVNNQIASQNNALGGVIGQLPGMGVAVNLYYSEDAVQTVDGAVLAENTGIGAAVTTGPNRNIAGRTAEHMTSEAFADEMNKGLSAAALGAVDSYLQEQGFEEGEFAAMCEAADIWRTWNCSEGTVLPTGGAYEELPAETIFDSGDGSKENPYIIMTVQQLKDFAVSFSDAKDYTGIYLALGADLDISGEVWTPIGENETGEWFFQGTFDGRNHVITGLTIGSEAEPYMDEKGHMCFGLFGALGESAAVKNLGITNAELYITSVASVMAAPLAGYSNGAGIDSCYATGTVVTKTQNNGNNFAGGLVGEASGGYIVNCWTDVTADSESKKANAEAGGIAALAAFGVVANCYTLGDASGWTDRTVDDGGVTYLSGLVGCQAGQLANCYQTGSLVSRSWSRMVGSIAGMASGISSSCYNYYNLDAVQEIDGMSIIPVEPIGQLVGGGTSEDGEPFTGGIAQYNEGMTEEAFSSQELADKLNSNFAHFPIDVENELPDGVVLKTWIVKDGIVTFSDDAAVVTYVPVEQPEEPVVYVDGTYYGRAVGTNGGYILVKAVVEEGKVVSLEIVSHSESEGFEELAVPVMEWTLETQTAPEAEDGDSRAVAALKEAIAVVLNKALLGDTSGYDTVNPAIFDGGTGTQEDPYQIATAEQLRNFAASVNEVEHFAGKYIVLTEDISLADMQWSPVGGAGAYAFSGVFDGQNHIISHMTIGTENTPASYIAAGMFACLDGAVVKNLGMKDAYINTKRLDTARCYAGIIAGAMDNSSGTGALIDHCAVSGIIVNESVSWSECGGIAAYCWGGIISNCGAEVQIASSSSSDTVCAGGITGMDGFAGLLNNYAIGSVTASAGVNSAIIGGLAGMQAGVSVNNYTDVSLISTSSTADVGGITGRNTGIAALYTNYYSSDAKQQSGNTIIFPAVGVGTNVTMGSTGIVENVESRTSAEMRTEVFRDLLNSNRENEELLQNWRQALNSYGVIVPESAAMEEWVINADHVVVQKNMPELSVQIELPFDDVGEDTWFYQAVQYVYENGLFYGVTDHLFVPEEEMSRGMFVTVLYRAAGEPSVEGVENRFSDVENDRYYTEAILWASSNDIVNGIDETHFDPDRGITREEAAAIFYRYAQMQGLDTSARGDLSVFPDEDSLSPFAEEAMSWAVGVGLINGSNQGDGGIILAPVDRATRAQAAALFMRFMNMCE